MQMTNSSYLLIKNYNNIFTSSVSCFSW